MTKRLQSCSLLNEYIAIEAFFANAAELLKKAMHYSKVQVIDLIHLLITWDR